MFVGKIDIYNNTVYDYLGEFSGSDWTKLSYKLHVKDSLSEILLVPGINDSGKLLIDNINVAEFQNGEWNIVHQTTFENRNNKYIIEKNKSNFYEDSIVNESLKIRNHVYQLSSKLIVNPATRLYAHSATYGDFWYGKVDSNISYKFPIALLSDSLRTFPKTDHKKLRMIKTKIDSISLLQYRPELDASKTANLIVLWNVFRFFYPYTEELAINWQKEFINILDKVSEIEHEVLLLDLVGKLKDGHGKVQVKSNSSDYVALPMRLEYVKNRLLITEVYYDSLQYFLGAELKAINDTTLTDYLDLKSNLISAPNQYTKMIKLVRSLSERLEKAKISLDFELINGSLERLDIKDYIIYQNQRRLRKEYYKKKHHHNSELTPIPYISFKYFNIDAFSSELTELITHDIIIIDSRDFISRDVRKSLAYFHNKMDTTKWLFVPKLFNYSSAINPEWIKYGWTVKPNDQRYNGRIIFLVNNRLISYGESIAAYFEKLSNVTVVGQPTAGTNGDINKTYLPGGFTVTWTGTKVLKHDGSQLHGIGIIPDVHVERTQKGIAEGRDEVLEKAIELARENSKN
ncbi:MAG: S41 family peptidase [Cyclobacteriaceae bacterium]